MKVPVYVFADMVPGADEISYAAYFSENSYHLGKLVHTTEVEIPDVPLAELVRFKVGMLRKRQTEKRAACERDVQEIEEDIGKLLCLEAPKV